MKINANSQFGTTGVADAGAAVRVHEGPASARHLPRTPIGDPVRSGMSS